MRQVRSRRGLWLAWMALIMIPVLVAACAGSQGLAGPQGPAGAAGPPGPPGAAGSVDIGGDAGLALVQGMAATAAFLDEAKAVEAGYAPTDDCVFSPAGAMGLHYVNVDLVLDGVVDASKPEVLMYIPTENGPKLVGFEYVMAVGPPGSPVPDPAPPAPVVGGQNFNGPMEGHNDSMPPHFDLHVWGWSPNPDGLFEDFNPVLSCPE